MKDKIMQTIEKIELLPSVEKIIKHKKFRIEKKIRKFKIRRIKV